MARANINFLNKNNILFKGASGKVGGVVFRQTANGTVIANAPRKTKRKPNEQQVSIRNRFADAAEYAREQMQNGKTKQMYQSKVNTKINSSYLVAVKDYLTSPRILSLNVEKYRGKIGNAIIVEAEDDFKVSVVTIVIKDASGKIIERGPASKRIASLRQWIYIASVNNELLHGSSITACAEDLPGNQTTETALIPESQR